MHGIVHAALAPSPAPCATVGTPFVTITQRITNDPDSGVIGSWAIDAFTEKVNVWLGTDGVTYCANASTADGTFVTAGLISPEKGTPLAAGITGTFTGGENYTIPGTFALSPDYSTSSPKSVTLPDSATAGFSWWVNNVFPAMATSSGSSYTNTYSLTYVTPHDGTWTDADPLSGGDSGDIGPAVNMRTNTGYSTIQEAVDAAVPGDTIDVAAGTYPETVSIAKPLALNGIQAGVPGASESFVPRSGDESVVDAMNVSANGVTVNGFTFTNPGVQMNIVSSTAILSGVAIENNIFNGYSSVGMPTDHAGDLLIEGNLFTAPAPNSEPMQIKSDGMTGGCSGTQVVHNVFMDASNNGGADINFSCTGSHSSNVAVSGNMDNGNANGSSFVALSGITDGIVISDNHATGISGSALFFWGDVSGTASVTDNVITGGGSSGVSIHGNDAYGTPDAPNSGTFTINGNDLSGNLRGVYLGDDGGAFTSSATVNISGNNFSGEGTAGVQNSSTVITAANVNASGNWWGASTGPADTVSGDGSIPVTNASGTGSPVIGAVKYSGWCTNSYCDMTPPTLVFVAPTATTTVSSTLSVSVTASDGQTGIANVFVHVYNATGTLLGSCGSGNPSLQGIPSYTYDCTLNVSAYSDGTYTLRAGTTDVAGNITTASMPFVVSHEAVIIPAPVLAWPVNGDITPTNVFTFRWNPTTSPIPGSLSYEFHSSMNPAETNGVLTTGLWDSGRLSTTSLLSSGAPDGTWYWQVRAIDSAGNMSPWSSVWAVTLNTVPPPAIAACPAGTKQVFLETDAVNSKDYVPTVGSTTLADGQTYLLVSSGTWQNGGINVADTAYASVDNWSTYMQGYHIGSAQLGYGEFQLRVGGSFVDWGAYQPSHRYSYLYTGTGQPLSLMVFDGNSSSSSPAPDPSWCGDNSGSLSVNVYACQAPVFVTTNAATGIGRTDATLNAMNGDYDAAGHSFWVSTSTFSTASPVIPKGVYSTPDFGAIASDTPFSAALSSLETNAYVYGQSLGTMPAVQPGTTYHYVAWSYVNGAWHPGAMQSFTTVALGSDDTLSALGVSAGAISPSFDPGTLSYTDVLPYNTTMTPVVTATSSDPNATVNIVQATSTTGTATVTVTAQNGSSVQTYTVSFSVAAPTVSMLTVKVIVDNGSGGSATSSDFTVKIFGSGTSSSTFPGNAEGTTVTLEPDTNFGVNVIESHDHYIQGFAGDCHDESGLPPGNSAICTITETYRSDEPPFIVIVGGGNSPEEGGGVVLGASISGNAALEEQVHLLQEQLISLLEQYLALLHSSVNR